MGKGEQQKVDDTGAVLVYDGDCPVCSSYVRYVRVREAVGSLMKDGPSAPAAAPSGDMAVVIGDGDRGKRFESRYEKR